jgi:ribosomal protein L30/L7E
LSVAFNSHVIAVNPVNTQVRGFKTQALPAFKADRVSFTSDKEDKEENVAKKKDKINSASREKLKVLSSLGMGFIQPIKDIYKTVMKNPVASAVVIALTAAAMKHIKLVGTLLTVGICALGSYKVGSGTLNSLRAIRAERKKDSEERDYAKANNNIKKAGEGIFDVALTANAAINNTRSLFRSGQAVSQAKEANTYQKIYALLKQIESKDDILRGPANIKALGNTIKHEGINEINKLKRILTGSRGDQVPESILPLKDALVDSAKQKEVLKRLPLDELEKMPKVKGNKELLDLIRKIREGQVILKEDEFLQIVELAKYIETPDKALAGMKAIKTIADTASRSDDALRIIAKRVKTFETSGLSKSARVNATAINEDR